MTFVKKITYQITYQIAIRLKKNTFKTLGLFILLCNLNCLALKTPESQDTQKIIGSQNSNKFILIIWDGLRPDVITKENTPILYQLKTQGSYFSDHHSAFPSITMNNANSIATGSYSGNTGFYGNKVLFFNNNQENTARPELLNIQQKDSLKKLDNPSNGQPLLYLETVLEVARKNGLKTAQIGKLGPILLQDANKTIGDNIILTEDKIYPEAF